MALSGQALEHCNKLRKAAVQLTNKRHFTVEDLTKAGKRKRGAMDQLLCMDIVSKYLLSEYKMRPSYYARGTMQGQ